MLCLALGCLTSVLISVGFPFHRRRESKLRDSEQNPIEEYSHRLRDRSARVTQFDRQLQRIGSARLSLGIFLIVAAVLSLFKSAFSPVWLLLPISLFAGLVVYDLKVRGLLLHAQRSVAFYRAGIARIEDRWAGSGLNGQRFADPHHVYSGDLDLFGTGGLFELLCLARTRMGEERLAKWISSPAVAEEIKARQIAAAELRVKLDLREDLAVLGEAAAVGVRPDELVSWAAAKNRLQQRMLTWLPALLAVAAVAGALTWYLVDLPAPFIVVLTLEAGLVLRFRREVSDTIRAAESTFDNLDLLSGFLTRLERERFLSSWLATRLDAIRSQSLEASRAIANLRGIVQRIQSRRNIFMAILDVPLMITLRATVDAEAWRNKHGDAVAGWLDIVGDIEALASVSAYSYEHPADPFPELLDGAPTFNAAAITHPLIASTAAVRNDVNIDAATPLWLVSGSNMSGKSTLLRTIGVNAVLAMAGAPVRAGRLQLSCLQVGASIRINDSLQEGSSRFYAEITRLRQLHELALRSPPLLVLLDELLNGTNSADRRVGAAGVLHALTRRRAIGLVSTHDLALTEIASEGAQIVNVHFEDSIEDGKMKFDFKLRPGVVTKSNALELMRTIGLDV